MLGASIGQASPWWSALGWHKDPSNYCGGYYSSFKQMTGQSIPLPGTKDTTITSDGVANLAKSGDSVLRGNVILKQPGRIVLQIKLLFTVMRNCKKLLKSGYMAMSLFLLDHVRQLRRMPYYIRAPNTLKANKVLYRIKPLISPVNAWGAG